MGFFTFVLVLLLVITCFSIEKLLKDIREQNKEMIELLKINYEQKNKE